MVIARTAEANLTIGPMKDVDWDSVRTIYGEGIATGNASIETEPPPWDVWNARYLKQCRLVARWDNDVIGWVALSPYSARAAYHGVTEVSIYVAARARSQGVGRALLEALIAESERCGIWALQAGIFPENNVSIALHTKCGFRVVGTRERLGKLHDKWRDVILFERRSTVVGTG